MKSHRRVLCSFSLTISLDPSNVKKYDQRITKLFYFEIELKTILHDKFYK